MAINSLGAVGSAIPSGEASAPHVASQANPAQQAVSQQQAPNKHAVEQAVQEIKQAVAAMSSTDLSFSIDGDTKQTVVRVVDTQTGHMVRQIPAQEVIDIAKAMDRAQGLLLRQKA